MAEVDVPCWEHRVAGVPNKTTPNSLAPRLQPWRVYLVTHAHSRRAFARL